MIDAMKQRLVQSNAERVRRIEAGDITVVGVNAYTETAPSPLVDSLDGERSILVVDAAGRARAARAARGVAGGARRRRGRARARHRARDRRAAPTTSPPPPSRLARAGGTVGEWAGALRDVFGEYRAPTGVGGVHAPSGEAMVRAPGAGAGARRRARPPDPHPRRQARPRRPLQRRRADRGGRTRRGHGGRLPGHPAHARADRGGGAATRTSTWSGLSVLSGSHRTLVPEIDRAAARQRRRRAGRRRRDHPRGRPAPSCSPPAWRASTRRRTSASATSSPSWPSW